MTDDLKIIRVDAALWPYPAGTPVYVLRDDRSVLKTVTRSEAWNVGSGHGLVEVEGISGGYALCRVKLRGDPKDFAQKAHAAALPGRVRAMEALMDPNAPDVPTPHCEGDE